LLEETESQIETLKERQLSSETYSQKQQPHLFWNPLWNRLSQK